MITETSKTANDFIINDLMKSVCKTERSKKQKQCTSIRRQSARYSDKKNHQTKGSKLERKIWTR